MIITSTKRYVHYALPAMAASPSAQTVWAKTKTVRLARMSDHILLTRPSHDEIATGGVNKKRCLSLTWGPPLVIFHTQNPAGSAGLFLCL